MKDKQIDSLIETLVENIKDYDFINKFNSMNRNKTQESILELLEHRKCRNIGEKVLVLPEIYDLTEGGFEFSEGVVHVDLLDIREMLNCDKDEMRIINCAYRFIEKLKYKVIMPDDFEKILLCKALVVGKEILESRDMDVEIEIFISTTITKLRMEYLRVSENL